MNTGINIGSEVEMWKLQLSQANHLLRSGAIPSTFNNPEQVLAVIQYGRENGLAPMTALQNINLIKGKPSFGANLIGSKLKQGGYDFRIEKYEDDVCVIKFMYPNGDTMTETFTLAEAKKAGYSAKDNYAKMPKEMLYARCLARGGRKVAPEVLAGIYAPEELGEEKEEPMKREPVDKQVIELDVNELDTKEDHDKSKEMALKRAAIATDLELLKDVWTLYPQYHEDKDFKQAMSARKEELQAEALGVSTEENLEAEMDASLAADDIKAVVTEDAPLVAHNIEDTRKQMEAQGMLETSVCPECGAATNLKKGTKNGKDWAGYFCEANKDHVKWINTGKGKSKK